MLVTNRRDTLINRKKSVIVSVSKMSAFDFSVTIDLHGVIAVIITDPMDLYTRYYAEQRKKKLQEEDKRGVVGKQKRFR